MTSNLCKNYLKINEDLFQKEAELKGCIKGQHKINKAVFEERVMESYTLVESQTKNVELEMMIISPLQPLHQLLLMLVIQAFRL